MNITSKVHTNSNLVVVVVVVAESTPMEKVKTKKHFCVILIDEKTKVLPEHVIDFKIMNYYFIYKCAR